MACISARTVEHSIPTSVPNADSAWDGRTCKPLVVLRPREIVHAFEPLRDLLHRAESVATQRDHPWWLGHTDAAAVDLLETKLLEPSRRSLLRAEGPQIDGHDRNATLTKSSVEPREDLGEEFIKLAWEILNGVADVDAHGKNLSGYDLGENTPK